MSTARTFHDKWHQNPDLAFRQTNTEGSEIQTWILRRNGFASPGDLAAYLRSCRRILDAGCGNGRVTALLASAARPETEIIGVDLTAADVARRNLAGVANVAVEEGNVLGDLSSLGQFDFIYCQEVLHHTGDAAGGFANLAGLLAPGGELAVYVYKKKAPVREFTDDHVRAAIAGYDYERAMEVSRRIAEIGRQLSTIDATVNVPDVPELGIDAGDYDVQRFVYFFFFKCFWSDELSAEDNAVLNFDWYRPEDCSRHTLDEVLGWCADNRLDLTHELVDEYGITVRAQRPAS